MHYQNTLAFAKQADENDVLKNFRNEFLFPQHNGENVIYFTGNSLGLEPKNAKEALLTELEDWAKYGVEGHFHARHPWFSYHEMFKQPSANIVGALPEEVTAMNTLTTNLHLLMVSFYRPTKQRFKIICEKKAFPSDQYALESQVKYHGFNPDEAIIEVAPREGEHTIREEDILQTIEQHADEVALVLFGGVNYYTGQLFDMEEITKTAHKAGALAGFDLAHAAGNVELKLHDWQVDFAVWCSYKYLNSGPGSVSGIFVHQKHGNNPDLPRFAGWWGNDPKTRFLMEPGFVPAQGADGWMLSNAPVFSMAVYKVSLDMFNQAGMENLLAKQKQLTGYLEYILQDISARYDNCDLEIITPKEKSKRGCQLSVFTHGQGKKLFDYLMQNGVIADWREPNVIRMAPVPMYNSFEDVYKFGQILEKGLQKNF
tara:strand:- start:75513 stop:76796 length:1284 start_codon:yes stop_codon:yes gene_type:complete